MTDDLKYGGVCEHGNVASACDTCARAMEEARKAQLHYRHGLSQTERRERQRLAWLQFMAALLADGLYPVQGAPQADEAMEKYNERWERVTAVRRLKSRPSKR